MDRAGTLWTGSKVRSVPLNVIQDCYLLAGEFDYLLRVIYRDAADLERIHHDILTNLPGVVRVNSTLTLACCQAYGQV